MTKSSKHKRTGFCKRKKEKVIAKTVSLFEKDQNFESLPKEIILHVFGYLKVVDLVKCGQVSKRLRVISKQKRGKREAISRPVGPKKYQKGFSKFEALPNEIILNVFSFLPTEELPKCRLISKRFKDISDVLHKMQPPNLWEVGPSTTMVDLSNRWPSLI